MSRAHSSISCARGTVKAALNASKPGEKRRSPGIGVGWGGVRVLLGSKPSRAPLSAVAGAAGAPLPETDCLLLFLHLPAITSVFLCVICCPIATWKPSFLPGFWQGAVLSFRAPAAPSAPSTPRRIPSTGAANPARGAFCSGNQHLASKLLPGAEGLAGSSSCPGAPASNGR